MCPGTCSNATTCGSCVEGNNGYERRCGWVAATSGTAGQCINAWQAPLKVLNAAFSSLQCPSDASCASFTSCYDCVAHDDLKSGCVWDPQHDTCGTTSGLHTIFSPFECPANVACSKYGQDCAACKAAAGCDWCGMGDGGCHPESSAACQTRQAACCDAATNCMDCLPLLEADCAWCPASGTCITTTYSENVPQQCLTADYAWSPSGSCFNCLTLDCESCSNNPSCYWCGGAQCLFANDLSDANCTFSPQCGSSCGRGLLIGAIEALGEGIINLMGGSCLAAIAKLEASAALDMYNLMTSLLSMLRQSHHVRTNAWTFQRVLVAWAGM